MVVLIAGDGAGVGKGRMLAAIILENWLRGRKRSVWLSTSPDLLQDAIRDLRDVGALVDTGDGQGAIGNGNCLVKVIALNTIKYTDIKEDAVIFATYSSLIGSERNSSKTRLNQLVKWMDNVDEPENTGIIAFDEVSFKALPI